MAENIDYSRFAGRVIFPRNPTDLLSTSQCPACFTPLTSTVCRSCGLDLSHPAAAELREASLASAATLDTRLALIGRIRYDQAYKPDTAAVAAPEVVAASSAVPETSPAAAAASAPDVTPAHAAAAATTAQTAPAHLAPAQTAPAQTAPVQPAPVQPAPAQPGAVRPKNSTIQIVLLVVGVSLLSIAAIFFLVYAFVNYGAIWRTVIIAGLTIATFVAATLLRRRKLTAAAEGVSALAAVFVYGDAFALRANDYFGLASSDGALYWGTVLVGSAVAFHLWHRFTGIRIANIVAAAAFAPGVGTLIGGLIKNTDAATKFFFIFAVIAAAGLVHRVALPRSRALEGTASNGTPERIISLTITSIALLTGFALAFSVAPASDWSGTIAALALAAIVAAHLYAAKPILHFTVMRVFAFIFAGLGAIFAASAVGLAALRIPDSTFDALAPPIAAAVVALLLDLAVSRSATSWKRISAVGMWSAVGVLAVTLVDPVARLFATNLERIARALDATWSFSPTDIIRTAMESEGWTVLALAIIGLLTTVAWWGAAKIRRRGPLLIWFASAVVIAAVAIPSIVWTTVAGWLLLAIIAVLPLALPGVRARMPLSYRAPLFATTITSVFLGYVVSWASTSTWWIGSLVAIAVMIALRLSVQSRVLKALLLGIAGVLTLVASSALAQHVTHGVVLPDAVTLANGTRFLGIAAALMLLLSAVPINGCFTHLDRRVMFWLGGVVSMVASLSLLQQLEFLRAVADPALGMLLLPEFVTSLAVAMLVLGAICMWVTLRKEAVLQLERAAASVLIAPAVYFVVVALVRLLNLPELAGDLTLAASALIAAVASLAVSALRPTTTARGALDAGVVLVALPAAAIAVSGGRTSGWLVLLILAVTVLVLAISRDGLFTSGSPRRHLGWLALALATAGLWWKLADSTVQDIEPYVLPLTGALLIIALLLERAHYSKRESRPENAGSAAPFIALGGLVVSLLPLAINASGGTALRAGIIAAVAALLLTAGSFGRGERTAQRWWDSAALAGGIAVVVLMIGRAAHLEPVNPLRDAWIAGGFVLLVVAAYGQGLVRKTDSSDRRQRISQVLAVIAMVLLIVTELPAFALRETGSAHAIAVVALLAVAHVVGIVTNHVPFTRLVGWIAIALALLTAAFHGVMGADIEPEFFTVPIGAALVITGAIHMRAVATARSWAWLAPGVAMLLVPSLIANLDEQNLWRTVILGVVGIAVIVIAVVRKLQAPLAIGVVVVLIHGIATFLPQLRAAYLAVPWWLWLAVGGILLIALAIRYERRIRDLKSVAMKFAELR